MHEPVLDRLDRHLLAILQENGRASNLD
ncbi:Lrp/AsnC family transcriptional regulator, partial [Pseudomonas sp. MWU12-2534b]